MFYEVFFECIEISNDSLGILVGDVGSIEQLLIQFDFFKDVIKE